jgi:solute carrier family 25 carnitine/acylcarnitine transporter 20/29
MGGGDVDALQKLTVVDNAIVGVAAGTIEVTILQPMLYCKNATQQRLPFTLDPRTLYRGLPMSIGNMAILTGVQFPLTGLCQSIITGGAKRKLGDGEQIAAGFMGGAISGLLCGPMELVMIQQQRFGGTLLRTPARLLSSFGASGIGRGMVTSCGREGMFTAGYMGLGPVLGQRLRDDFGLGAGMSKILGACGAGLVAATLSHPMDTIKTCMQGDVERKNYGSLSQTARSLLADGGPSRFFRGWAWRTGRMMCAIFIMTECKTRLSPIMFPHYFEEEQKEK